VAEASALAANGSKYIGTPYKVMDCQAFVEQCLKDAGISINLPGSNAWYRKMTWRGSPEECRETFGRIPVGAMLFIVAPVSSSTPEKYRHDGLGDAEHIGIYTGSGQGALHSSSTRQCVAESKFAGKTIRGGGWNMVGLWDKLSYGPDIDNKLTNGGKDANGGAQMTTATVIADSGSTVKMRAKPDRTCSVYWDVPIGTTVMVVTPGTDWSEIIYTGKTGWMMTKYLMMDPSSTDSDADLQQGEQNNTEIQVPGIETVTISRDILVQIYDALGNILGLRG